MNLLAKSQYFLATAISVLFVMFLIAFYVFYGMPKTIENNVDRHRVFISDITNRIYFLNRFGQVAYPKTNASGVTAARGVFANRPPKPHCNFDMKARPITDSLNFYPVRVSGPIIQSKRQWFRYFYKNETFEYWLIYHGPPVDFRLSLKNLPDANLTKPKQYIQDFGDEPRLKFEKVSRDLTQDHLAFIHGRQITQEHFHCEKYTITRLKVTG